jgi:hypothetical protein
MIKIGSISWHAGILLQVEAAKHRTAYHCVLLCTIVYRIALQILVDDWTIKGSSAEILFKYQLVISCLRYPECGRLYTYAKIQRNIYVH